MTVKKTKNPFPSHDRKEEIKNKRKEKAPAWRSFFLPYIPSANDLLANGDLPKGKCFATRGAIDLVSM